MPDSLVVPALLAIVFVPPFLTYGLRHTRLWWLAGAALITLSVVGFATTNPDEGHGGPALAGAGTGGMAAALPLLYGMVCLALGGRSYVKWRAGETPPSAEPPASGT